VPLGQISSLDQVERWIKRSHSTWAAGSAFTWSIEQREDHILLGQITLAKKPEPNTWALAFWTHPGCWGQGYSTEAAERILEFGFLDLGAALIWAGAAEWNHASLRVLEKLGMVHVSDNPEGYFINGEPMPTKEFEISRDLWQSLQQQIGKKSN
jgi:RimJ/RimL family protein N-acetyltransferase